MNFHELHACTRRTLQGRYRRVLAASLFYPTAWLVFRLAPCVLAWVLIDNDRLTPRMLLLGGLPLWMLFSVLWAVLRFCILLPLGCGTLSWFSSLTGLERAKHGRVFFRNASDFMKAVRYFLCVELLRILAALPLVLGAFGAASAFRYSIGMPDGGFPLFLAAQSLCIAAAGGMYYLRFSIGLAAVPFLFLEDPNGSPFAAVQRSRAMLRGHRLQLVFLILWYLPAALPLVTIPFLLPGLLTNYTLFLQIRMREWEQQEEEAAHANTDIHYDTQRAMQT